MKELVTLEDMKEQLNILIDDDDAKIMRCISAASAVVLSYTGGDSSTYPSERFVPVELREATIVLVTHAYEDPLGEMWPEGGELPPSVRSLLSSYHDPVVA